jgi:hypothetical protein
MPLPATGSPLVAGSYQENHMQPQQQPATLEVEVLRAFYFQGKAQKVGTTTTLPRTFALEMRAANKARILEPKAAPAEQKGRP